MLLQAVQTSSVPQMEASQLQQRIAAILHRILGASILPELPFTEAGLDSLGAVELRTMLAAEFEVDLPATMAYDYPTITALAHFIASQLPSAQPMALLPGML